MPVNGILGRKVGMTQLFDSKGDVRPVTVLKAGPCVVTQLKTATRDGYEAAQIGLIEFVKDSRLTKAMKGHLEKHNLPPVKFVREMAVVVDGANQPKAGEEAAADGLKVGDKVLVELFEGEKFVDIAGTSKGRGFAGVVRRHHFGGGPASHGHMFQVQGSIGGSLIRRASLKERACPVTWDTRRLRCATCGCSESTRKRTCWWSKARFRVPGTDTW